MQLKNYGVQQINRGQNYFHFRDKIIPEYAHVACSRLASVPVEKGVQVMRLYITYSGNIAQFNLKVVHH